MNPIFARTVCAAAALVVLGGCAGKPAQPPMAMSDSDPHSKDPNRTVCRQLPPPTGSLISQDPKVCHTYAEWQQIEKYSQDAIHHGQRMPGQGSTFSH